MKENIKVGFKGMKRDLRLKINSQVVDHRLFFGYFMYILTRLDSSGEDKLKTKTLTFTTIGTKIKYMRQNITLYILRGAMEVIFSTLEALVDGLFTIKRLYIEFIG